MYCKAHLISCESCGLPAPPGDVEHRLCELCAVFTQATPNPPLPFDDVLIQPFVQAHAGWRKSSAQVRWSVGTRYVLVWVKTALIGKSSFVVFDFQGTTVDVCRPNLRKEWLK